MPWQVRERHPEGSFLHWPWIARKEASQIWQEDGEAQTRQLEIALGVHSPDIVRAYPELQSVQMGWLRQSRQLLGHCVAALHTSSSTKQKTSLGIEQQQKLMNQQSNNNRQTLRKAGQLAVASNKNHFLQQVNDDDEFQPLSNITTTFEEIFPSEPTPSTLPLATLPKSTPASRVTLPKQHTANDLQYLRLASELKNNTKAAVRSLARKKEEKQRMFLEGEEQLAGVEYIIEEIQSLMSKTLQEKGSVSFKPKAVMGGRSKKSGWHSKPVKSFSQNDGFSKLEELLLNYQVPGKAVADLEQEVELPKQSEQRGNRRQKREDRREKNKKYEQIQKDLAQVQPTQQPKIPIIGKPRKESNASQEEPKKEPQESVQSSNIESQEPVRSEESVGEGSETRLLKVTDIEIVELDWCKLPVILTPLSADNAELFLRMRDYPEDQSFMDALMEVVGQESTYKAYSIYDPNRKAGMSGEALMSEQEFRQKWAQEWSYDVEQESNKQLLGEWDFQWYRSLVQLTYSHSLQEILVKGIKYDPQLYLLNLSKIHGAQNDKNKLTDGVSISSRIPLNRLKFVEVLLGKFQKERLHRSARPSVILGVIPSISEGLPKEQLEELKEWVQKMFVGGLYSINEAVMGVMVTLEQASAGRVERLSPGVVKLGGVHLLINGAESQWKGEKILLRREKLKNSWVHIGVMRGSDEESLEVGEELHFGRRYRLDLD